MQITISGQQLTVTTALRSYVADKLERIMRHFDHLTTTNVVLHVEKSRHLVEATINAKGTVLHANAEAQDMYSAIDELANKLDRQVLKHKEKSSNHHRRRFTLKDQRTND
ncbi:MAG: ribosome-associated translation inhibitor RaiA [Gammaproteobacteria bacterium]|nr:ribosome-associated translation inhibitor RaiA [Gammaproteobacteria bacterium]